MCVGYLLVLNEFVLYTFWLGGMVKMVGSNGWGGYVDLIVGLLVIVRADL